MQNIPSLKISLIDDDALMRTMLEDFVREKYPHAELSSWSTGEEALKHISEKQDLFVLDYNLDSVHGDSMNGIEIFKQLKTRFPAIPVIFISGQDESKIAASTILHGANDYIIKNEKVFERLDASLTTILGKPNPLRVKGLKQRSATRTILILLASLLAGFLIYKIMN